MIDFALLGIIQLPNPISFEENSRSQSANSETSIFGYLRK